MKQKDRVFIKYPADIFPLVKRYANSRQENFLAITLTGSHYVIKVHHITKGLANKTIVHPRESFYPAIKDNASAIIFAHNHPSGNVIVSPEDEDITKRLCMAGDILGFHVVDHIIFAKNEKWLSCRQCGIIHDDDFVKEEIDRFIAEFSYSRTKEG